MGMMIVTPGDKPGDNGQEREEQCEAFRWFHGMQPRERHGLRKMTSFRCRRL
jgi:hypothetical protein